MLGTALTLGLAACTGGGTGGIVTTNASYYPLYSPSLYQWVAASRDVPVRIFGAPSNISRPVWDQAVTDAMNRSSWISAGNITTTPNDSARGNFDFVMIFGATSTMWAKPACANEIDVGALGPVNGRLAILGVFCNEARPITTARVTVDEFTTPDSPVLQAAMDQMLVKMLPRQDPNRPDRRGGPLLQN